MLEHKRYCRGLRPYNPHHPRLFLSRLLLDTTVLSTLPPAPETVLIGANIPDQAWGMQANDVEGDCGPAAFVHQDMAALSDMEEPGSLMSADTLYRACSGYNGTPETDTGVDPFQFADWLVANGYAEAWAEVDHPALVKAAANCFGGLLTAVACPDNMDDQFEAGNGFFMDPRFPAPAQADHFVFERGFNPDGSGKIVTWGGSVLTAADWLAACVHLRLAFFTKDMMSPTGLSRLGINHDKMIRDVAIITAA
jgi:hypothetical protein